MYFLHLLDSILMLALTCLSLHVRFVISNILLALLNGCKSTIECFEKSLHRLTHLLVEVRNFGIDMSHFILHALDILSGLVQVFFVLVRSLVVSGVSLGVFRFSFSDLCSSDSLVVCSIGWLFLLFDIFLGNWSFLVFNSLNF